jgi:plastocyanin
LHVSVSRSHISRKSKAKRRASQTHLRSRRLAVVTIALIAALALIAVGFLFYGNPISTTPSVVVVIIPNGAGENLHLGFEPYKIMIVIGVNNTVVWKNEDSTWHTAHSNIPEFNSGLIQPSGSFTHTFQRAGTYPYHCDPHPWMTGVVIVKTATSTDVVNYWWYEQGQLPQSVSKLSAGLTFTNPSLNIIVPIPPDTIVTLTYTFSNPGVYDYVCRFHAV